MTWKYGALTIPTGDEPLPDSQMPLRQTRNVVEFTPIGATQGASTITQHMNSPSIGAAGTPPWVLHHHCTEATADAIAALEGTQFTLEDDGGDTYPVELKMVERYRWMRGNSPAPGRHHVFAHLIGR